MRGILLTFAVALWSSFDPRMGFAEISELPLDADVCAIKTALIGRAPDGCREHIQLGSTRSIDAQDQGYFIHFAFDSEVLSADYQRHLTVLSESLVSDDLSDLCLLLVGHTDAVGSLAYNQSLSERRAQSVKSFLVDHLSMSSARFSAVGEGETDLLVGHDPSDPSHRRVEILARGRDQGCTAR